MPGYPRCDARDTASGRWASTSERRSLSGRWPRHSGRSEKGVEGERDQVLWYLILNLRYIRHWYGKPRLCKPRLCTLRHFDHHGRLLYELMKYATGSKWPCVSCCSRIIYGAWRLRNDCRCTVLHTLHGEDQYPILGLVFTRSDHDELRFIYSLRRSSVVAAVCAIFLCFRGASGGAPVNHPAVARASRRISEI